MTQPAAPLAGNIKPAHLLPRSLLIMHAQPTFADAEYNAKRKSSPRDRLPHHATTINIKGKSYRLKEKRRAGMLKNNRTEPTEKKEPETAEA